jgi:hypothetical protein
MLMLSWDIIGTNSENRLNPCDRTAYISAKYLRISCAHDVKVFEISSILFTWSFILSY